MDSINSNLYSNIRLRATDYSTDSQWKHDEDSESSMLTTLRKYRDTAKQMYMRSLLNPEYHISKIPSRMPVESAVAALKYNFNITPNASGKFCLVIDPFFHQGFLYQDAGVNGTGGGTVTNISFSQDSTIIDQWRLVSASVILKYYGNFSNMAGFFVAATGSNVGAATASTFLTFSNVEDFTNKQVLKCIDGCKLIFSPMDEKATEFNGPAVYTAGTHPSRWQYLFIIVGDAFPNTSCIRVDYFRNIEYNSTSVYKEYIPQTKDLPSDTCVPNISTTVSAAPVSYNNTTPIGEFAEDLKSIARDSFKDMINGVGKSVLSLNPLAYDNMKNVFIPGLSNKYGII